MKVVGLITEYNPFHNGHKYHIEEAKRITGADYVIAVMSGNFVQRGAPAIIDKYSRTEMALYNGIDLVLELPVCYATGSAEFFAHGAVSLLDKLGIVDYLCFGSEVGDIQLLQRATQLLLHAPESFDEFLQNYLKEGYPYPAARQMALKQSVEMQNDSEGQALTEVLSEPNNILGIEYLKALHNLNSSILPVTIKRIKAHYHAEKLSVNVDTEMTDIDTESSALIPKVISSATAIRKAIPVQETGLRDDQNYINDIEQSVPADVYHILKSQYQSTFPITEEDFSTIIKYKLLSEDRQNLTGYLDISSDLADRLSNLSDLNCSIAELTDKIKTRNMTKTRISRALLHLLLNIRKDTMTEYKTSGYTPYARVLGVRKSSTHLLRQIEKLERIPIITKVSDAEKKLDQLGLTMLNEDIFAAHIYNQVVYEKFKTTIANEYKHGIILL